MTDNHAHDPQGPPDLNLLSLAIVLGLVGGLIEGVVHVGLLKFGEHSWYQIVWIAAVVNGMVLLGLALAGTLVIALVGRAPALRGAVAYGLAVAAVLPVLTLLLKEWIQPYAIVLLIVGVSTALGRWLSRPRRAAGVGRALPWAVAATAAAFIALEGGPRGWEGVATARLAAAQPGAPDILVIVIDAMRGDRVSSAGYVRQTTPTLDRLVREGVLFKHAFSTSSYTLPSHASILTGLLPFQHGVEWQTSRVHATAPYPILPEALRSHGYRTGGFSANTFWFSREHGFGRGFLHFDEYFHSVEDRFLRTAYGRLFNRYIRKPLGFVDIPGRRRAVDINRAVLNWTARDTDRPFLAVLNYMDVHDPYLPPQPYRRQFSSHPNPGGLLNWEADVPKRLSANDLQSEVDANDGAIAYVDAQIGHLLTALSARRTGRSLLVIVTSDHGDEFFEHGGFLHGGHLYREVLHVPLIVWQPGRIPAGRRVETVVSNASIPATILRGLGSDWPPASAPPLQPLWERADPPADWPAAFAELRQRSWAEPGQPVRTGSLRSVIDGSLHYIEHDSNRPELYDWISDPAEAINLADRPEMREDLDRLRGLAKPARDVAPLPSSPTGQ